MSNTEISKVRIAIVQIPYLPVVVIHSKANINTLLEPEGSIYNWLVGEKNVEEYKYFVRLLESNGVGKEKLEKFFSEYINWLNFSLGEILNFIICEDPDIIVFPEYSLPIELSKEIEDTLVEHSKNRYIFAGVGVVYDPEKNREKNTNKFVRIHNGEIVYGEKKILSEIEKRSGVIKSGNGPFLHPLEFKNGTKTFAQVAMCSECIALAMSVALWKPIIKEIEEYKNKGEMKDEKGVGLLIVPSLSPERKDINNVSDIQSKRGRKIACFANCSFFGGSQILFAPYKEEKLEKGSTDIIGKGKSGVVIADIPLPARQVIPITTEVTYDEKEQKSEPYKFSSKIYPIKYLGEGKFEDNGGNNEIIINTQNFMDFICKRLNIALIYLTIILLGLSPILENSEVKKKEEIEKKINSYKRLQEKIIETYNNGYPNYKDIQDQIMPYLNKFIFENGSEQYISILEIVQRLVNNKYKNTLEKVKKDIKKESPYPFHYCIE